MAACGSLQHIFEKPLPENPTLLESLSPWSQIKSMKRIEDSSFTEIFGELHFKESHAHSHPESSSSSASSSTSSSRIPLSSTPSSSFSSSSFLDTNRGESLNNKEDSFSNIITNLCHHNERNKSPISSFYPTTNHRKQYRHSDSFSSMNSDSLSLCTEGLGFESSDDVEELRNDICFDWQQNNLNEDRTRNTRQSSQLENRGSDLKRSKTSKGTFPPPISCIGRSGKPWVCFKSYREDGRFILKEIRIPTQEFLHACREDGRLRLQFIQSDDEILEEDEEEEEYEASEGTIDKTDEDGETNDDCDDDDDDDDDDYGDDDFNGDDDINNEDRRDNDGEIINHSIKNCRKSKEIEEQEENDALGSALDSSKNVEGDRE